MLFPLLLVRGSMFSPAPVADEIEREQSRRAVNLLARLKLKC